MIAGGFSTPLTPRMLNCASKLSTSMLSCNKAKALNSLYFSLAIDLCVLENCSEAESILYRW